MLLAQRLIVKGMRVCVKEEDPRKYNRMVHFERRLRQILMSNVVTLATTTLLPWTKCCFSLLLVLR